MMNKEVRNNWVSLLLMTIFLLSTLSQVLLELPFNSTNIEETIYPASSAQATNNMRSFAPIALLN